MIPWAGLIGIAGQAVVVIACVLIGSAWERHKSERDLVAHYQERNNLP